MNQRIYKLQIVWRLLMLLSAPAFIFVPIMLVLNWKREQWGIFEAFLAVALFSLGIIGFIEALVARLVISSEGLDEISIGVRTRVTWDKVERFEVNPYGFTNLVLRQSSTSGCLPIILYTRLFGLDRLVGIAPFVSSSQYDEFVAMIREYAPHIKLYN